jgi:hypothetical protein
MMPRMREGGVARPGRRILLLGAVAAPVALAGCGVRLEDDAPPVPLVPTREPLPEEDALTALTRACADLVVLAEESRGALAAALVPVHRRQHAVLRTSLVRMGVPAAVVDAEPPSADPGPSATGPTTTGSTSPSPGPTASGRAPAALGTAEATAARGVRRFTDVDESLRDTVAALHAQRFAAALLLRGRAPAVAGGPVSSDVVEELAARTQGARYLLEVVAARTDGRLRDRALSTLEALHDLFADQVAGGSVPEVSLGTPLPFPVRTPAAATRLATTTLDELRAAHGARLATLLEEHGDDGWAAATRWLGAVEAQCHRWGLPLAPFPGLT